MAQSVRKHKKGAMGVPWYTESTWNEMKKIAADQDNFHNSFQEWLAYADRSIVHLTNINRPFVRLNIDPISYSWWCKKNSLEKNRESRRQYIQYLLENQQKKSQATE